MELKALERSLKRFEKNLKGRRGETEALVREGTISLVAIILGLAIFGAYVGLTIYNPATCVQSAASEVYLTVLSDNMPMTPVQGAAVNGNVKWLCGTNAPPGYFVASSSIGNFATPANGTVSVGSIIGNYSLAVQYSNHDYPVEFSPGAEQNVQVTLFVPSGSVTVVGCVFGSSSSCFNETNPASVTMITEDQSSTTATSFASCNGNCTASQTTLSPTQMRILSLQLTDRSLLVTLQNTGDSDLSLYNIVVDQNTTSDPILRSVIFFDVLSDGTLVVPPGNFTGGTISVGYDLMPNQIVTFNYSGVMSWQHGQGSIAAGNTYWLDISGHFADVYVKTVATG